MNARILTILAAISLAGCSSTPTPACNASVCDGCCSSTGQCVAGNTASACGASGGACDVCVGSQTCSAGKCEGVSATGGGSGSGTGGGSGSGTGGGQGEGGGSTSSGTGAFPDIGGGSNGRQPVLIIDATGTRHLLYEQLLPSGTTLVPYRYGECTNNCTQSSSWAFTDVGDRATFGTLGKLALNAQGKPRVMWSRSNTTATTDDPYVFHFASCDSNCTQASGWTEGPVLALGAGQHVSENTGRNLVIDGTGRAHFIYSAAQLGLNYITCASNCTQAASWSAPLNLTTSRGRVSLAVTAAGGLRVAFTTQESQLLAYRTCDANCASLASWSNEVLLMDSAAGQVSLRLDAQGRPRVFFNQNGAGTPKTHDSYYGWCESNCTDATAWQFANIGLPAGDGKLGLDFDLHANGAVSAAIATDKEELSVVQCTANCQSLSATWYRTVVEDSVGVAAQVMPQLPNCSSFMPPRQPYSFWFPGEQASAAVNPVSDKLEVTHRTYTLESCGLTGNQKEGVSIPRFSGPF